MSAVPHIRSNATEPTSGTSGEILRAAGNDANRGIGDTVADLLLLKDQLS
jgi:hypothetical protein